MGFISQIIPDQWWLPGPPWGERFYGFVRAQGTHRLVMRAMGVRESNMPAVISSPQICTPHTSGQDALTTVIQVTDKS